MSTNLFFTEPTPEPRTKIRVSFRQEKSGGDVFAAFLDTWPIQGYEHTGQHCECSPDWIRKTKPAKDYRDLLAELERIGYDVTVMKMFPKPNPDKITCPKCGEIFTPSRTEYEQWCRDEDRNLRLSFDGAENVKRMSIKEWGLKNHKCKAR